MLGELDGRESRRGLGVAEGLLLLGALLAVELLLGIELALADLDDAHVACLGLAALEELELAPIGRLVRREVVGLATAASRHASTAQMACRERRVSVGKVPSFWSPPTSVTSRVWEKLLRFGHPLHL